ncbi:winged helix-turn-helix transcriptional regulator [Rhodoglobus sp.]
MATGISDGYCEDTVRRTIDLVRSKWAMRVLWKLLREERRYAEVQRRVGGISQKVLSGELKTLVEGGVFEREVTPTVPPQVSYRVTTKGRSLEGVFVALDLRGRPNEESAGSAV